MSDTVTLDRKKFEQIIGRIEGSIKYIDDVLDKYYPLKDDECSDKNRWLYLAHDLAGSTGSAKAHLGNLKNAIIVEKNTNEKSSNT